jgi:hypothetical protein
MAREYLLAAATAAVLVVLWELLVLRTGLFRRLVYWVTMAIVLGFQVPVDGWLTRLDAPIVLYADWAISGVRAPDGCARRRTRCAGVGRAAHPRRRTAACCATGRCRASGRR